jgi:putative transposase
MVDGAKEFNSKEFELLTARFAIRVEKRPPAKPRFGSVIERFFGTLNTQLIYQLAGNTQVTKNVRMVTKGNDPKGQAVWTLASLENLLEHYFFMIYDEAIHSSLGESPREFFRKGNEKAGIRGHREIDWQDFIMWTYPTTKTGKAKVQPRRGVQINYIYYWCEEFRSPNIEKTKVEVRYDPFDIGMAFAWVQGKWHNCVSSYHHIFKGRSVKDLRIAGEELRKAKSHSNAQKLVTAKRLAEFVAGTEATERRRRQELRDAEKKGAEILFAGVDENNRGLAPNRNSTEETKSESAHIPKAPVHCDILSIVEANDL